MALQKIASLPGLQGLLVVGGLVITALLIIMLLTRVTERFDDMPQLSDADRRLLQRAALTTKRQEQLNVIAGAAPVAPNCYATTDADYNTAGCRSQRNAQTTLVNSLVTQNKATYCNTTPGCTSVKRDAFIASQWNTKCASLSDQKLAQNTLFNNLVSRDNTTWVPLADKKPTAACSNVLGKVGTITTVAAAQAYLAPSKGSTPPTWANSTNSIVVSGKDGATFCSDLPYDLSTYASAVGTTTLLAKQGINNQQLSPTMVTARTDNDNWLDTYWYFSDSASSLSNNDRLAKCADVLSQNDFLQQSTQQAAAQAAPTTVAAPAATISVTIGTDVASQYMAQRALKKYSKDWYTQWKTVLTTAANTLQSTLDSLTTKMNAANADKSLSGYNTYVKLLAQQNTDNATVAKQISGFNGGKMSGATPCFGNMPHDAKSSLTIGKTTYTAFCPDPASVCAAVAATPVSQQGTFWKSCKSIFDGTIKADTYTTSIDTAKKQTATATALSGVQTLQNSIDTTNASIQANAAALSANATDIATAT